MCSKAREDWDFEEWVQLRVGWKLLLYLLREGELANRVINNHSLAVYLLGWVVWLVNYNLTLPCSNSGVGFGMYSLGRLVLTSPQKPYLLAFMPMPILSVL